MRLLLAVHLNDGVEPLIAQAALWAERLSATLDLIYVDEVQINSYLVEDPSVRAILDEQWSLIHERTGRRVQELLAAIPAAHRGEASIRRGRAEEEIVAFGQTYDAILVGTHGRTGLTHLFLGSVAERVARSSSVPVLVLRLPIA